MTGRWKTSCDLRGGQSVRWRNHPEVVEQSVHYDGHPDDFLSLFHLASRGDCPFLGDHTAPCRLLY